MLEIDENFSTLTRRHRDIARLISSANNLDNEFKLRNWKICISNHPSEFNWLSVAQFFMLSLPHFLWFVCVCFVSDWTRLSELYSTELETADCLPSSYVVDLFDCGLAVEFAYVFGFYCWAAAGLTEEFEELIFSTMKSLLCLGLEWLTLSDGDERQPTTNTPALCAWYDDVRKNSTFYTSFLSFSLFSPTSNKRMCLNFHWISPTQ